MATYNVKVTIPLNIAFYGQLNVILFLKSNGEKNGKEQWKIALQKEIILL